MSTAATSSGIIDVSGTTPVPFSRLVSIEWRKMLDTRSGRWLLGITVGLLFVVTAIVLIVLATSEGSSLSYSDWIFNALLIPLTFLLPVFPILCVTSEWSQRTGLTTFVLESNRTRLIWAKLTSVMTLALATLLFSAVVGVAANLVGAAVGGYDAEWEIDTRTLVWTVVVQILYFLMAFGLGAVLLNSPAAVTLFYVFGIMLPFVVYFGLVSSFDWASNIIPFFDLQTSSVQVTSGEQLRVGPPDFESKPVENLQYLQFGVATVLWVVIPMVLGFFRIKRTEIK